MTKAPRRTGGAQAGVYEPSLAVLRDRLAAAPPTKRARQAQGFLRIAETHLRLVEAMLESGLEDRPQLRKPTLTQRLRAGLETGTFALQNAPVLLADLDRAAAGDRQAQLRVTGYLQVPGVLEALDVADE